MITNIIKQRILKCNGNPVDRFNEDRLRILRALRYTAIIDGKIDIDTSKAITDDNRLFGISEKDDVSKERIFAEFVKVHEKATQNSDPFILKRFIDLLVGYNIMEQLFPVMVLDKDIKPTTDLVIAIAQTLRKNIADTNFKNKLIDAKIPIKIVETISILINIYNLGITPDNVYMLHREISSKHIEIEIIEKWLDIMNMQDKFVRAFIHYTPSTTGHDVMVDGFKGAQIGEEIRRRESEKYIRLVESIEVENPLF